MNNKELEQLFKLCRKYGLKHYKTDTVELVFSDDMPIKPKETPSELKTEPAYTEEELLMWSAGN